MSHVTFLYAGKKKDIFFMGSDCILNLFHIIILIPAISSVFNVYYMFHVNMNILIINYKSIYCIDHDSKNHSIVKQLFIYQR